MNESLFSEYGIANQNCITELFGVNLHLGKETDLFDLQDRGRDGVK